MQEYVHLLLGIQLFCVHLCHGLGEPSFAQT